jgi:hypothetical protein
MAPVPKLTTQAAQELLEAWIMAAGFCLLASIPLAFAGVASLFHAFSKQRPSISFSEWLGTVATVFASYFVAATLASPVYTLCRAFRTSVAGSILTGALVAPIIYCSVAAVLILFWHPAGELFFGDHGITQPRLLTAMPWMLCLFALIGAIAGPYLRK